MPLLEQWPVAENKKVTFSIGVVFVYVPMLAPRRLAHSAILPDMEDTNTALLGCRLQDSATMWMPMAAHEAALRIGNQKNGNARKAI